jgi:hypothetical protein
VIGRNPGVLDAAAAASGRVEIGRRMRAQSARAAADMQAATTEAMLRLGRRGQSGAQNQRTDPKHDSQLVGMTHLTCPR